MDAVLRWDRCDYTPFLSDKMNGETQWKHTVKIVVLWIIECQIIVIQINRSGLSTQRVGQRNNE